MPSEHTRHLLRTAALSLGSDDAFGPGRLRRPTQDSHPLTCWHIELQKAVMLYTSYGLDATSPTPFSTTNLLYYGFDYAELSVKVEVPTSGKVRALGKVRGKLSERPSAGHSGHLTRPALAVPIAALAWDEALWCWRPASGEGEVIDVLIEGVLAALRVSRG